MADMDSSVHETKLNIMADYILNDFAKFFVFLFGIMTLLFTFPKPLSQSVN